MPTPAKKREQSVSRIYPSEGLSENGLADLLADRLKGTLRIHAGSRDYYSKIGNVWSRIDELQARCVIENVLKQLVQDYTARKLNALISLLQTRLIIEDWTTDRNFIPMQNGVFDWRKKELLPYSENHYFNWQLAFSYSANDVCPNIDRYFDFITDGDQEFRNFLLCWMVAIVTGRSDLQKFLSIIGPAGSGKGVYFRLIESLIGSANIWQSSLRQLEENRFETSNLRDIILLIISEADAFGKSVEVFKSLLGQDPVRAEKKNKQPEKPFVYRGMVLMTGNHPLNSPDKSGALSRRQSFARFTKVVSDEQKLNDPDFEKRLQNEIPGLFNLVAEYSHDDVTKALRAPPPSQREAKLVSEMETNPILHWAHERVVLCQNGYETLVGNANKAANDGLFSNYREFCIANGEKPKSMQDFSRLVVDACISKGIKVEKIRASVGTKITGLRLRDDLKDKDKPLLFVQTNEGTMKAQTIGSAGDVGSAGL